MSSSSSSSSSSSPSSISVHLCCFIFILLTFLWLTWYIKYDSIFEGLIDQIKLVLMMSPLLLLLVLHLISTLEKSVFFVPEQESFHRVGGAPWGLGFLLVLLFFMISYQSDFRERWFPLLS